MTVRKRRSPARSLALLCSTALTGALLLPVVPSDIAHAQAVGHATGGDGAVTSMNPGGDGGGPRQAGADGSGSGGGAGGAGGVGFEDDGSHGGNAVAGSASGGGGGGGGAHGGVLAADPATNMTGGDGGNGGWGDTTGVDKRAVGGGGGGAGGDGALLGGSLSTLTIGPGIELRGGNGGDGSQGASSGGGVDAAAGGGGAGLFVGGADVNATIAVNGTVAGGRGGDGIFGGGGGAGIVMTDDAQGAIGIGGTVSGGDGDTYDYGSGTAGDGIVAGTGSPVDIGVGSGGNVSGGRGHGGGSGGAGLRLDGGGSVVNEGTITGGEGGHGSRVVYADFDFQGGSGSGGAAGATNGVITTGFGGVGIVGSGLTVVNAGIIAGGIGFDDPIAPTRAPGGQANAITFTGGANTLRLLNATSGLIGNIDVTGTLTFDQDGIDTEVANVVSGSGAIIKTGDATLRLSGVNSFAGGTTILGGVIEANHVDGAGVIDALGDGRITLSGGTLRSTLDASTENAYLIAEGTTGTIAAAPGTTLHIRDARLGRTFTLDGSIVFGSATDTGTIIFQAASMIAAPRNEMLVAGGTLIDGSGAVGDMAKFTDATRVNAGATLDFGNFSSSIWNLQDGAAGGGRVKWQSDLSIAAGDFSGSLGGPGALLKTGDGTLRLTGANSFAGGTTILGGTLEASHVDGHGVIDALGDGLIRLAGGTLRSTLDAGTLNAYLIAAGRTGTITAAPGTNLYINGIPGHDFTVDGNVVFGSVADTGTIVFQPLQAPTAATSEVLVAGGTLVDGIGTFGDMAQSAAATRVNAGATLDLANFNTSILNLQDGPTGGGMIGWQSDLGIAGGDFSGALAGPGALIKDTSDTLTLTGDNQVGRFTVRNGTLAVDGGTLDQPVYVGGNENYVGEATGNDAALLITNGGKVSTTNSFLIGNSAGSKGSVIVEGDQSRLDMAGGFGGLSIGFGGDGTLSVTEGGHVSSPGFLNVGGGNWGQLGNGLFSIDGAGSSAEIGTLTVAGYGDGSTGAVTVSDGGVLNANDTIRMGLNNTIGSAALNIGAVSTDPADAVAPGTLHAPEMDFYHDSASLNFNHTGDAYVFDTPLVSMNAGNGFIHHYAGSTSLTGDSSGFSGDTIVHGGTLAVNGTLGGAVNVESGGTLGGSGLIGGDVDVNGTLSAGNSPGTLTLGGNLTLGSGSTSVFELNTPGLVGGTGAGGNDLVKVGGNLTLGGALDARVAAAGYYRLFNYDGTLTGTFDSGALTGTGGFTPLFPNDPDIRYDTPQQVNLSVLGAGQAMLFWDGTNTTANGTVDGGIGTWSDFGTNWTDSTGSANGGWGGSVGVLAGAAGDAVTVDGRQSFDTLQFSTDGYTLAGGTLALSPAAGTAGTLNIDNGVSATIGSSIVDGTGSSLKKAGGGTLVLEGNNTFTGGTLLLGGLLSVSADANLGDASGELTFDGGMLRNTATFTTARDVTLRAIGGTFQTDASLELTGVVAGDGKLTKTGNGALILSGANSYSGGTAVSQGQLTAAVTGALGTGPVNVVAGGNLAFIGAASADNLAITLDGAALRFYGNASAGTATIASRQSSINFDDDTTAGSATIVSQGGGTSFNAGSSAGDADITAKDNGTVDFYDTATAGNATLTNMADGYTRFHGDNTADAATVINKAGGTVDISELISDGIGIGSLSGGGVVLLGSKTLTVGALSNDDTISGSIQDAGSGGGFGGNLVKTGTGRLTLTGTNTYSGGTTINAGTLQIGNGDTGGLIQGDVKIAAAGTLAFNREDDIQFIAALRGSGAIEKLDGGTLRLTGDSAAFAGTTTVDAGKLVVDGALGGSLNVLSGATLGGSGTVGTTTIASGATIAAGNSPGTLTVAGNLTLNGGSTSVFELNTPGMVGGTGVGGNDLIEVGGNLSLGGTLDARVAAAGYYRLFDYDGTLTGSFDNGTLTGTGGFTPLASGNPDIRYDTPRQVNLSVLGAGQAMQFWDGGNTSANGSVDGGVGTWSGIGTNWTDSVGSANGGWGGSVGVFAGIAGGAVTVDGTQRFDTLQFSTDGYTLAGGTLALAGGTAGTLNIDTGVSTAIASTIADGAASSLKKTGGGTLVLSGANTYTGGTQLLGGVLSVSSDANLGGASRGLTFGGGTLATTAGMQTARAVTLQVTGSFDVAADSEFALRGVVSGPGDLLKTGSGTLRLTGANTYGNTLVRDGTLIGDANSISGSIGNDATVVFDQDTDGIFAGSIGPSAGTGGVMVKQGAGALMLTGPSALDWSIKAGGLAATAGRFDGNVDIALGASLTFDQTAAAAYGGALSGTGRFTKTGTGALVYDGDGSGFAGSTTIADGGLIVGSDAAYAGAALGGSFDVQDGGTLGGHGSVGSGSGSTVTIASGGTIAPGNSIGTLAIDGDLVFAAGSTYEADIDPALAGDLIDVSGAATINGGTVRAVKAGGTYTPGSRWTIIGTDGGVSGTFDALTQNMPFVDLALAYDASNVYIDATRNVVAFCDVARTRNQCATGDGLETTGSGNPVYDALAAVPDEDSARLALDALSGEIHASANASLIEDSHFVRDAVNDRIRSAFGDTTGAEMPLLAYGPDGARPASPDSIGPVAWGQAFGAWGSFDGDGNAAGMDTSIGGFLTGIDASLTENWRLGLLAGYSRSSFTVDGRASSGSSDNYHLGLYGGGRWDALRLSGGLAYTWHDIDTSRSAVFPGLSEALSSDYRAGTFQVFGEAGHRIDTAGASFEPFVGLAHVSLHTDGFTENGGQSALKGGSQTMDATFTTLGLHASTLFDVGGASARAHGTLGWQHAFGDTTPLSSHAFAGGSAFTVEGVPIADDAAVIEAGLDFTMSPNATLGIAYQGRIASEAQQHGFSAKLDVKF